jgi:hypothetical protein
MRRYRRRFRHRSIRARHDLKIFEFGNDLCLHYLDRTEKRDADLAAIRLPVTTSRKVELRTAMKLSPASLRALRVLFHRSAIRAQSIPPSWESGSRACEALSENPQYPQTRYFHFNPMEEQALGAPPASIGCGRAGIGLRVLALRQREPISYVSDM